MKNSTQKIFTTALIVVIAVGAAIGGWMLYRNFISKAAVDKTAVLSINPATGEYNKSDTFAADLKLDTGGHKVGTIVANLTFDKDRLEVVSLDDNGSLFNTFTAKSYKNDTGKMTLMASTVDVTTPEQESFNGSDGQVIKVNFKVKANAQDGTADFKYVEGNDPLKGTLVNKIAGTGEEGSANILKEVKNASYTIGEGGGGEEEEAPPAPTGLKATDGWYSVTLDWNKSAGATGYKVYYGTESGKYVTPVDVGNKVKTVLDEEHLTYGTKYYFVVTAYNDAGESKYSNEVTGKPHIPGDLDYDKDVDPVDFQIWNTYRIDYVENGYTEANSDGDMDGNKIIDPKDFAVWTTWWIRWTQGSSE